VSGPWPRVIILVVILVFVAIMTRLGLPPEVAAGIATMAIAAARPASGELPGAEA
jgi:hypothetical protein